MEHVAHQNFTGARGLLAVSYLMTKRGLLPVVVFLGLCFSLAAEQASGSPSGHGGAFTLAQLRGMAAANNGSVLLQPTLFNSLANPVFGLPFSNRDVFSLATTFNLVGTAPPKFPPFFTGDRIARSAPSGNSGQGFVQSAIRCAAEL